MVVWCIVFTSFGAETAGKSCDHFFLLFSLISSKLFSMTLHSPVYFLSFLFPFLFVEKHGMMDMSSSLRAVPSTYEITVQSNTMVLNVNRVSDSQDDAEQILYKLVEQIVDLNAIDLRTSYLSVDWVGEPGEGPGPIREFFGSYLPCTVFTNAGLAPPFSKTDATLHSIGGRALFETTGSGDFFWPAPSAVPEGDRWVNGGTEGIQKYLKKVPGMKSAIGMFARMEKYYDEKNRCALWCKGQTPGPSSNFILGHVVQRNMYYECCGRCMGLAIMSRSTLGMRLPKLFFSVIQTMMRETKDFTENIRVDWKLVEETDLAFCKGLQQILKHNFLKNGSLDMYFTYTDVSLLNEDYETVSETYLKKYNKKKSTTSNTDSNGSLDDEENNTNMTRHRLKKFMNERPLIPSGDKVEVNDDNKEEFVSLFATSHVMNHRYDAFRWLSVGLLSVFPASFYLKFTPKELQSLICSQEDIDVAEWKSACQYERSGEGDAMLASSQSVVWFWKWVEEGDVARHRALLEFWSGSKYPPVFGFKALDGEEDELSGFKIHRARDRNSKKDSLPTAATCDRRLELPTYKTYSKLAKAMEIACTWGANGFSEE